jgi:SagB-type dehydrogenase family enzyme
MGKWIIPLAFPVLLAIAAGGLDQSSPGSQSGANSIPLPEPDLSGMTVSQAIRDRRSVRHYAAVPLSVKKLSQLLFAAQGITARMGERSLRAAPSAGALYPIELYVVIHNVADLSPGLYHYRPSLHALEPILIEDLRAELVACCLGQEFVGQAGVALVMTALYDRTTRRYGERGRRYVHMEAGHISQNIYLQATSLGLGSVVVGAFRDDELNELLRLKGTQETALYVHPVGNVAAPTR